MYPELADDEFLERRVESRLREGQIRLIGLIKEYGVDLNRIQEATKYRFTKKSLEAKLKKIKAKMEKSPSLMDVDFIARL